MPQKQPFAAKFALRVMIPSIVAASGIAALLLYIVNGIFDETNRLDGEYARRSASAAITSIRESLGPVVENNAVWDEAKAHAYGNSPDAWLDDNWGRGSASGVYDAAFVVDADGTTIYAAHNGKRLAVQAEVFFGDEITALLAMLPSDNTNFGKASGLIKSSEGLSVVSAGVILPASEGVKLPATGPRYLVLSKAVDGTLLATLSQRFVLDNLHLSFDDVPRDNSQWITGPSGKRIASLVWINRGPGNILKVKYGNVVAIVLAMFLFVIAILIHTSWRGFREAHASQADAIAASIRDDLTGLANRRELLSVLKACLAEANPGGLAVVYADLDGFKEVNDSYGHEIGDLLLKSAAAGFAHLAQGSDLVARLGGDEFAIIVTGSDAYEKSRFIARSMIAFLSEPMIFGGRVASVSVSVGIVDLDNDQADVEEIIRRADVAMYAAKAAGRNRLHIYERSLDFKRDENRAIARSLREHIDSGSLTVVYQPIVDARSRRIKGVEALVRWPKDTTRHYTPDVFIPVAEEFGLIEDVGYFVLTEACRQAANWPEIFVAVNVSPIQFMNPGFADLVEKTLRKTGLDPKRLEVEVTEGFIIDNAERANAVIGRLHDMRVGVVLDDFGTGYSSIGHLRRFKFDKLKLDRSMVVDILRQPSALRLVQGTIAMADALGLAVVAEGIEDENQVSVLRLAGCSQFQGYLFSRPVEAEKISAFLTPESLAASA